MDQVSETVAIAYRTCLCVLLFLSDKKLDLSHKAVSYVFLLINNLAG